MSFKNKEFLLEWNSLFPLDYWWRKKYNIPFNSRKHREVSYIDIYYEWLEDELYKESLEEIGRVEEKRKYYSDTGEWLRVEVTQEQQSELMDLFDKMDVSIFNEEGENKVDG